MNQMNEEMQNELADYLADYLAASNIDGSLDDRYKADYEAIFVIVRKPLNNHWVKKKLFGKNLTLKNKNFKI